MFLIIAALCFGLSLLFAWVGIISWDTFIISTMIFCIGAAIAEKS